MTDTNPLGRPRICGPKSTDHPSVGTPCPECGEPFVAGDMTVLVSQGPADDENREKMMLGRAYTARAVEVHAKHTANS